MKNILSQIAPLATSIAFSVFLLGATTNASFAATTAPDYRLTPTQTVTGTKVVNETLWRCNTNVCTAATANSRPEIVCAQAARKVGKVSSFSYKGTDFDASALEKCNAKAK
jgi:hypothetical protein